MRLQRDRNPDPAVIDAVIDVNLKAPMHLTRALLPGMVERKRGHLRYIGSSGGQAPYSNMGAYRPRRRLSVCSATIFAAIFLARGSTLECLSLRTEAVHQKFF
jgi:NAD(P)-dependent dehydrogenase (short-subunit alcohol dehydrogenase family)